MKKRLSLFFATLMILVLCLSFVACNNKEDFVGITFSNLTVDYDGNEHAITCGGIIPDGTSVVYANNKATEDGEYNATATISKDGYKTLTLKATLKIVMTAQHIVNARAASVAETQQNYDFNINLAGNLNLYGFEGTANANYDGAYRFNSSTGALQFKRVTGGVLLYDSIEYIYNTGSSKVKIVANEDGEVSRTSVIPQQDEELNLLNIPFAAILDHTQANNLSNITKLTTGEYNYQAKLVLASNNQYVQKVISLIGKLGTSIDMGDVSLSNPANGIDLFFNLSSDKSKLTDFMFSVNVAFPVKGVGTTLSLTYAQKANFNSITIPSVTGLITESTEISNELSTINNAITSLKNADTYSLDLVAANEFDPGWNTNAIVDEYFARLYKNTNGSRVDFNQSFEYKAHTEKDGAETFKYTYGNIEDGSVHLVSRKGANTVTAADDIDVNTQFEYLVGAAMVDASDVDCIKKTTKDGSTFYNIYLKKDATLSIKDKITGIINSNEADGVVDVDNYFNASNYMISDSSMVVEMKDGKIVSINLETNLKYSPTSGDFTEAQITLTNSIGIRVNAEADKAAEYAAPQSTNSTPGHLGLNNAKFYIR